MFVKFPDLFSGWRRCKFFGDCSANFFKRVGDDIGAV